MKGWKKAVIVDGTSHWILPCGGVGEPVDDGGYRYALYGDGYLYLEAKGDENESQDLFNNGPVMRHESQQVVLGYLALKRPNIAKALKGRLMRRMERIMSGKPEL